MVPSLVLPSLTFTLRLFPRRFSVSASLPAEALATSHPSTDPVPLAGELVRIPSPVGREAEVCAFMADYLARLGWSVTRQPVGEGGRCNVYATRGHPQVVFTTHLDTVLPELPVEEDDEVLRGRGAVDAKGIAATQVAAAERLAREGEERIALLFVVGEEGPSDGARASEALVPKGRYLVNGEPTENCLALGTKGSLRMEVVTRGRAAHSAYPEEGESAIDAMLELLTRIRALPLPEDDVLGVTTLNVGTVTGGIAANVIPDRCRAELMYRTVGPDDELLRAIGDLLPENATMEVALRLPPVRLSVRPGFTTGVMRYATDLPFFEGWGERFLLGPGTIRVAHTPDEAITKSELRRGSEQYVRLARTLLAEVDASTDGEPLHRGGEGE